MGCASSTPMIQTTGSEMLKAATHVATDATTTAEDAVEGIKDSVGKTLETAKDAAANRVAGAKQELENVIKEKSEMLEDATNSLMEKLHLKQTENENNTENSHSTAKTETDELKTQLKENLKHSTTAVDKDELAGSSSSRSNNSGRVEQTEARSEIKEQALTGTDTETDSLKTSTPEPEIEQAFAKSENSQGDNNDNPPTPKPTLAELENLTAEYLKEQHRKQQPEGTSVVNDMTTMGNDPVMPVKHEHIITPDGSNDNTVPLTADNNNKLNANQPTKITAPMAVANNDTSTTDVHQTPKNPVTAVNANHFQAVSTFPNTMTAATTANQANVAKDKIKQKNSKMHLKEQQVPGKTDEKRPRTTEWEKFADMLAQIRKFNPHDAFRRGGTYTKFGGGGGGGGIGHLRERTSVFNHHVRSGVEDDCSDTNSNFRDSPQNSRRSSARVLHRVQPDHPHTGSNRSSAGGHYALKPRRGSNIGSSTGRKFDYSPARSRVNEFVSSPPCVQYSFLQNTADTQMPYALHPTSYEGFTSPSNMRSHHFHSDTRKIALPPLDSQERPRSRSQPPKIHQHSVSSSAAVDYSYTSGNDVPPINDFYSNDVPIFLRQSSTISLFTNSTDGNNCCNSIKSSRLDVKFQATKLPTVKNTSSFLATPRSPFSLRKSYTDLYFSTTINKENKPDKSSFGKHKTYH